LGEAYIAGGPEIECIVEEGSRAPPGHLKHVKLGEGEILSFGNLNTKNTWVE
jgi:hypothetical protein